MEQYDNIYDKIRELLGLMPGSVSILEEQIDADTQLEYYNYTRNMQENMDPDEILKNRETIFHHDMALEDKKHLMAQLAGIDSIDAYRTLEQYIHHSPGQLKDWARLALNECRLLLESKLLDENQVLISTGLGGKNMKLRYYTVFITKDNTNYLAYQQKIVTEELSLAVVKAGGEIEKIWFDDELCSVISIIPLPVAIQQLFEQVIRECNRYGDFICEDYLITNVKIISNNEIREMIKCTGVKNKTRKV